MSTENPTQIHATGFIPAPGDKGKPITVIGTTLAPQPNRLHGVAKTR